MERAVNLANYTLKAHFFNIEFLNKIGVVEEEVEMESAMFSRINELADFFDRSKLDYSHLRHFNLLADQLVDIITLCNGDEYSLALFENQFGGIHRTVIDLIEEIRKAYPINAYFSGLDRYKMLNRMMSGHINLAGGIPADFNRSRRSNRGFDILIYSEGTSEGTPDLGLFDEVIHYDKFMNDMYRNVLKGYYSSIFGYDYNYLKNAIRAAKRQAQSLFLGNSYSRNGIDVNDFHNEGMVGLSVSSQDFYYSFKIAREIIDENRNIKRCYIGTGHWCFYHDLSKAHNKIEEARIQQVYLPLLDDVHNNTNIDPHNKIDMWAHLQDAGIPSLIFDMDRLIHNISEVVYLSNKSYFSRSIDRDFFSSIRGKKMDDFNEAEKYELGKTRADQLGKMLKYENTREENRQLLEEFLSYLNEREIEAVIVNFPTSKYYNEYIHPHFKESYYDILSNLQKSRRFTLIDLNEEVGQFRDEDYTDVDHLSASGAVKATRILKHKINAFNRPTT